MSETKTKILTAASELFLEGGLPALSVRAISKRAGMSTIGIYSHFQGKQGILDTLYVEGFEMVYKAVDINAPSLAPKEAVLRATNAYLDVVEHYQAHYRLIFGESDSGYTPSPEAGEVGAKAFEKMVALSATLLSPGAPPSDQQKTALNIWAIVHGYAGLQRHAVSQLIHIENWRSLILDAVAHFIDGLASPAETARTHP